MTNKLDCICQLKHNAMNTKQQTYNFIILQFNILFSKLSAMQTNMFLGVKRHSPPHICVSNE
jgi:hypothetical protein